MTFYILLPVTYPPTRDKVAKFLRSHRKDLRAEAAAKSPTGKARYIGIADAIVPTAVFRAV